MSFLGHRGILKSILHLIFFLTGIATVLIGQALPVLSAKLNLDDNASGQFFLAQFAGSILGAFIFNYLSKRYGFVWTTVFGLFAISIGCLLLNSSSFGVCLLGFFLNGIGFGTTLPSINLIIVGLFPEKTASALNILNFFWGAGAILCQPFFINFGTPLSILLPTSLLSAAMLASALILLPFGKADRPLQSEESADPAAAKIWNNPIAWMIAIFNFLHVGLESGAGGWLRTYAERLFGEQSPWISAAPFYFFFFVAGRAFAPLFLKKIRENALISVSLFVVLIGILLTTIAESNAFLIFAASVIGFGTSSVFPTNMARFSMTFGDAAIKKATPLFICGSLGGAYTTWMMGYISSSFPDYQNSGLFVLLGSSIALIFLQLALSRKTLLSSDA